jgi:hypothetical protein
MFLNNNNFLSIFLYIYIYMSVIILEMNVINFVFLYKHDLNLISQDICMFIYFIVNTCKINL